MRKNTVFSSKFHKQQKLLLFLLIVLLPVACHKNQNGSSEKKDFDQDTVALSSIDSLAWTLDALKHKPVKDGYSVVGDVQGSVLKYVGLDISDVISFVFRDANGKNYFFAGNNTPTPLIVPALEPTRANGGMQPNHHYLNKNFHVFWRTVQLDHRPKSEAELYYEMYEEIIYLKRIN